MELSTLYWVFTIPSIGNFFGAIGGILVAACLVAIVLSALEMDCTYGQEEKKANLRKTRDKFTKLLIIPVLLFFISVFIPTEKTMMYMIGGYAATNVEGVEKLPKNVINAANRFLEKYTEVEPKKD